MFINFKKHRVTSSLSHNFKYIKYSIYVNDRITRKHMEANLSVISAHI